MASPVLDTATACNLGNFVEWKPLDQLPIAPPAKPPQPIDYRSEKNPFGNNRRGRRIMNSAIRRALKKAKRSR